MIARRELLIGFGAAVLAVSRIAHTQAPGKLYRVAVLNASSRDNSRAWMEAFSAGLRELGYADGHNLHIEFRFADGKVELLAALVAELIATKPDVIYAPAPSAAAAAQRATPSVPIVFSFAPDPVALGFVQSLAHPGGNVTGLSNFNIEVAGKRVELLKEAFPGLKRVCVWYNPDNPNDGPEMREFERAAKTLGLTFLAVKAQRSAEYDDAAAAARKWNAQAIYITSNPSSFNNRKQIIDLVTRMRVPAMYWLAGFVEDGGLMAYAANFTHLAYRAATYVDKILKGAKAGDLPVEQPTKLELVINMKTAKDLGITIPSSILVRADKVIE